MPTRQSPSARRITAREKWVELNGTRHDHVLLRIQCARSHHVAMVYDTEAGPVFVSVIGPHAHGHRDFVDLAHHGPEPGQAHVDFVETSDPGDLDLPARCECGPRIIRRADILAAIAEHRHNLQVP